jgi:hypothetical protein
MLIKLQSVNCNGSWVVELNCTLPLTEEFQNIQFPEIRKKRKSQEFICSRNDHRKTWRVLSSGIQRHLTRWRSTDVSQTNQATYSSETSGDFQQTTGVISPKLVLIIATAVTTQIHHKTYFIKKFIHEQIQRYSDFQINQHFWNHTRT